MSIAGCLLLFDAELATAEHGLRYLGPTLRGVFGHVLKRTVCVMAHGECEGCSLRSACPYPRIFEGRPPSGRRFMRHYPAIPQPFTLGVADPGSWDGDATDLRWGVRLMGEAAGLAPYVVEAFMRSGEDGLGPARVPYTLRRVLDGDTGETVCAGGDEPLRPPQIRPLPGKALPSDSCTLRWILHSPLHLRGGGALEATPGGLDLVLAGRRRHGILEEFYGDGGCDEDEPEHLDAGDFRLEESRLAPWHISRYSGRQQRKVPLSGVMGALVITGPWHRAGHWMRTVEAEHLGKYASFGFGRVTWSLV